IIATLLLLAPVLHSRTPEASRKLLDGFWGFRVCEMPGSSCGPHSRANVSVGDVIRIALPIVSESGEKRCSTMSKSRYAMIRVFALAGLMVGLAGPALGQVLAVSLVTPIMGGRPLRVESSLVISTDSPDRDTMMTTASR